MDRFLELGGNTIHVPRSYFDDHFPQTALGSWLQARAVRDQVILIQEVPGDRATPEGLEEDLASMMTDYVDVCLLSSWPTSRSARSLVEGCDRAHECGLIRSFALSAGFEKFSPNEVSEVLEAAKSLQGIACCSVFVSYDLWYRLEYEAEYRSIVDSERLGVIARPGSDLHEHLFSAGMHGLPFEDAAPDEERGEVSRDLADRARSMYKAVGVAARETGATPAQVGLAWTLSRPAIAGSLAQVRSEAQLDALFEGAQLSLATELLAGLDAATAIDQWQLRSWRQEKEQALERRSRGPDKWNL